MTAAQKAQKLCKDCGIDLGRRARKKNRRFYSCDDYWACRERIEIALRPFQAYLRVKKWVSACTACGLGAEYLSMLRDRAAGRTRVEEFVGRWIVEAGWDPHVALAAFDRWLLELGPGVADDYRAERFHLLSCVLDARVRAGEISLADGYRLLRELESGAKGDFVYERSSAA